MSQDNYKGKGSVGFYAGADYGFDSNYGSEFSLSLGGNYKPLVSQIGVSVDLSIANQIQAVSKAINTGAKAIEASAVNITGGGGVGGFMDKNPKQQWNEINRLRKLTGVDLTFHGPLVEASGFAGRQGWSESFRQHAQNQMSSAVERAHEMDPDGNIVVTFHSGAGLEEMKEREMTKEGEKVTGIMVFNERENNISAIRPKENYLLNEQPDPKKELENFNKQRWFNEMTNMAFNARKGTEAFERPLQQINELEDSEERKNILEAYKHSKNNKEWEDYLKDKPLKFQDIAKTLVNNASYGELWLRNTYSEFQEKFNEAWLSNEKLGEKGKEDIKKLEQYKEEFIKNKDIYNFDNPSNLVKLGEELNKGINLLGSLKNTPSKYVELNDFVIDKSSETFSNVAFNSYNQFKDKSPIISIENPPIGTALGHAEDLRKLVDESRDKFVKRAVEDLGMSEKKARMEAEKLIGVTWDVGHINMLRKHGYTDEDLKKQTEIIAGAVKHIHLSDNFGMEHIELPMGMGNVPLGKHFEALAKSGVDLKKIKQIVETGDWISRGGLSLPTPLKETLRAFGSPIYAMQTGPSWSQAAQASGGYYSGLGRAFPDRYFNTYGSGFSNLPQELGGQVGGRSRVSGAPIE